MTFAVFSLPRSRSSWLKHWLSNAAGLPVGHDMAIESDSIDDFLEKLSFRVCGTCETGAVEAWPILRGALPNCRIVTVRRDLSEVIASLVAGGFDAPVDVLTRRAEQLDILSKQPGVLAVDYRELSDPRVCARLQEHCLGTPFNWPVWELADRINIQIDAPERRALLDARQGRIAELKQELAARLDCPRPFITVTEEPWAPVAMACEALGAVHHAEATESLDGSYRLDTQLIAQMDAAGIWRVFIARVDGEVVGYCCWTRETNHEADAPSTMLHGPFYVSPQFARFRLGQRLLEVSRDTFAASGVRVLKLHHTMYGRGARAGRLYERMGAVEFQREYMLQIGA